MDINPYEFEAPFTDFEYARFALREKCQLILFSNAWVDGNVEDPRSGFSTINYWATRLGPIIEHLNARESEGELGNCVFACANRIGTENDTTFVGSSCVVSLKEPTILASADKTTIGVVVSNITLR